MKKYTISLICVLLVTSALVAAVGAVIRESILKPLGIEREENVIALPFVVMADEILQIQIQRGLEKAQMSEDFHTEAPATTQTPEDSHTEPPASTQVPEDPASITEPEQSNDPVTEPPTEAPTEPVYTPVDESWFDDALFIGESRTVGLQGMARLGKADYFCAGSMTVYSIVDAWLRDHNFPSQNLESLLQSKTYGKIYIHLGLNELLGGADFVMEGYHELIYLIREYQPDAVIVIQSCMSISKGKASSPNFPIEELHKLNEMLRELALSDPEGFRFCDTNVYAAGEDGYIRPEITCDGCHLYGVNYEEWGQWILEDAGWYGIE